jgi:predicted  nucleic acid-binding Zn-ribbon protein
MSTELLIGGRVQADYVIIRQQLDMANEQLADMQREMERAQMENADRMAGTVGKIKSEMDGMRRRERALEQQLANVQAQNELLEFQLVELTEGNQQQKVTGQNVIYQ